MKWIITSYIIFFALNIKHFDPGINKFRNDFSLSDIHRIEKRRINFQDTIPNDTIYLCLNKKNEPTAFFRKLFAGVCYDGVCLPVDIHIFWTLTGQYLGFHLPENKILTKNKDHVPFAQEDYTRLHEQLQNQQSLLAKYDIKGITAKTDTVKTENEHTDGHTGATIPEIRNFIVPGAAYTTFSLWHFIYGETRDSIEIGFPGFLNFAIIIEKFENGNLYEKRWALNQLRFFKEEKEKVQQLFSTAIVTSSYPIKETAIKSLYVLDCPNSEREEILLQSFIESDFATRRIIINKLIQAGSLESETARGFIRRLNVENKQGIDLIFRLLRSSYTPNQDDIDQLKQYSNHNDSFLAASAINYLQHLDYEK